MLGLYQANTRWTAPLKTRSHATKMLTATPAARGEAIARIPATIINTLRAIDHPTDFFTNVAADVAPMGLSSLCWYCLWTCARCS